MTTPTLAGKDTLGAPVSVKGVGAPLLDTTTITAREGPYEAWRREWNAKRRRSRVYQRVMSGTRLGGPWQMWTLTTSVESWNAGKSIQASFRALTMRLRRRGLCSGYLRVVEYTKRGLPHLHVLIKGPPIPHWWLSEVWSELHMSPVVWFSKVRHGAGAGAYLGKYLGKDPAARYSWSWDWVWKGFVKDWKVLVRDGFELGATMLDIVAMWELVLDRYRESRSKMPGVG